MKYWFSNGSLLSADIINVLRQVEKIALPHVGRLVFEKIVCRIET